MNGSRSHPPKQADRTALEALNRTIEGLEARIEGLIQSGDTDQRGTHPQVQAPRERSSWGNAAPLSAPASDPLAQIRQRQQMLAAGRERALRDASAQANGGYPVRSSVHAGNGERMPARGQAAPRTNERAPGTRAQPTSARGADDTLTDIAEALVNLRQDLKRDISEGVSRQMEALREELRDIKATAADRNGTDDLRADMGRLADSIERLAGRADKPQASDLRDEFQELRALIDGLAREESLHRIDNRWSSMESQLGTLDANAVHEELVSLAYRLDDIKQNLGSMGDSADVRALEDKLISIATAMEHFGSLMQPHDKTMVDQFAAVDGRLDEITRAIAATGRVGAGGDPSQISRLEQRIAMLSDQIDRIGRDAAGRQNSADDLNARIEMLTQRAEELGTAETTARLDERLEHLAYLLEQNQKAVSRPDLSAALLDISRKIDGIESGSLTETLAKRLDDLARRIDDMDDRQAGPSLDDIAFQRIEGRLGDIAARLEENAAASVHPQALRNLEDQIAHLSAFLATPRVADELPVDLDRRMGAIEDYIATNDEYVVEAARQAAEAVVEAYGRNGSQNNIDTSALASLAADLRHLEELSRGSEERTHDTFKALHDTLVQIANRLDRIEGGQRPAVKMPRADVAFPVDSYGAPVDEDRFQLAHAVATQSFAQPPAAQTQTSALAIEAATAASSSPKLAKDGLLASLGKRFATNRKKDAEDQKQASERTLIDPSPSIDPVDVIPSEAANEPLEPGSGAPDVRKILERVRATQNAGRDNPTISTQASRADYIAAARRAAQAAAMEADPNVKGNAKVRDKLKAAGGKGVFARFRRPILLAAGAVLLAILAFPLGRTLIGGQASPTQDVAAVTTPAEAGRSDSRDPVVAPASPSNDVQAATPAPDAAPAAPETPALANATEPSHLTAPAALPADGVPAAVSPDNPPQDASAFHAPQQPGIAIPDAVQPGALADAARGGDPLALFEIGARYSEGRNGLVADAKEAVRWYELSAAKGFAPAQYRLGSIYEKGTGVARDVSKARDYYVQAAEAGNANAMHNLAVLYASGALGEQNYATAASWFTKAADLGIADSQFNLAILAARGNGTSQDLTESYKWFAIAARSGDQDAAAKRDEVAKALKPDMLEKARAKADGWKAQTPDARANLVTVPDAWTGAAVKTSSIDMKKAIRNIQAILNNNGFDAGKPDGELGAKTVTALKNFQKSVGLEASGKVDDDTVRALLDRNKPPATRA